VSLPNGSASAVERTLACAASLVLPRVEESDEYADRGHDLHAFTRAVLSGTSVEVAIQDVELEHRATCEHIDWRALVGDLTDIECESAFAIDVRARTARRLGFNVERQYESAAKRAGKKLGAWEMPGSLDIAGRRKADGARVVRDVKSGYQDVTPAVSNGQARYFGAAFHLLEGAPEVHFEVAKLKPSGAIWYGREARATFTALDVDTFLDELEAALGRVNAARKVFVAGGVPDVSAGAHCDYCSAADACPAKTALARAMLGELQGVEGQQIEAMALEQRGRAWELAIGEIKPLLDRVLKALKESIARQPVPLSNGKQARAVTYERENLVASLALALARELGASEEQVRACYRSGPVTQIRETPPPRARRGRAA
jgi:hypothetical protein